MPDPVKLSRKPITDRLFPDDRLPLLRSPTREGNPGRQNQTIPAGDLLAQARLGLPLRLEDLTALSGFSQETAAGPTVVLGQQAFLKHAFEKDTYELSDRTAANYQLIEDSNGLVTAYGADGVDFTAPARWVRTSGTLLEIAASYPVYDPAQPLEVGDRLSYAGIDGVNRLYESRAAQLAPPTTPPSGAGDDALYYAYSPVVADAGGVSTPATIRPADLLNLLNDDYWGVANNGEYTGPDMTTTVPAEYYRPATATRTGILLKTDGTPRGVSRFISI